MTEFFGQDQAMERAVSRWGAIARTWNRSDGRCEVGIGGVGMPHVVIGSAGNWLDASREWGLLDSKEDGAEIYQKKIDAFWGRYNAKIPDR